MRINATLVSVQDKRPKFGYGQLGSTPLKSGAKAALVRAHVPADVPEDAVVTKAELVFYARGDWTGSRTFSVQRNADGWKVSKVTWDNKPALTGTTKSVTVGAAVKGQEIRIDVTDHAQLFVAGTSNDGWRLTSSESTQRSVYGSTAANNKPWLDLQYVEVGDEPSDLSPDGGAVSVAKPTLTFRVPDDTVSIQVQVDQLADEVSPDWDSGEVVSTVGLLDLAAGGTYPGLATGAQTSWRARAKTTVSGWSDWSPWAAFSRVAKITAAITSPGSTTGDKTPPIAWTAPGQVTWQAQLFDAVTGKVLDESTKTSSADTVWTPAKGLKKVGDVGRAVVRVWDGVDRVATPGDPVEVVATRDFTLVAIGDSPGADFLVATQDGSSPVVRLCWGGLVPDYWRVTRDGEWIGGDLLDGTDTEFYDYTAAPGVQHVYQVLAVTDPDEVSPNGPTATITPTQAGAWLMDPETGGRVLILDADIETSMVEQAVVHNIVGDRPPVRRRSGTPPPSGTMAGYLLDSYDLDYPAAALEATAMEFKDADQGQVFRLAMGTWNIPVTIGDMTVGPALLDDTGRPSFSVGFAWWRTRWSED